MSVNEHFCSEWDISKSTDQISKEFAVDIHGPYSLADEV